MGIALEDRLHATIDGDLLVVAFALLDDVIEGCQKPFGCLSCGQASGDSVAIPKFRRRWIGRHFLFKTGVEIELDDLVRRVSET